MALDLAAIAARARAAKNIDGGWTDVRLVEGDSHGYIPQGSTLGRSLIQLADNYDGYREDCAFLAHARADVLALVDEVERLRTPRCSRCGGTGEIDAYCRDPQCGDSTWDHECGEGGKEPCPVCQPKAVGRG